MGIVLLLSRFSILHVTPPNVSSPRKETERKEELWNEKKRKRKQNARIQDINSRSVRRPQVCVWECVCVCVCLYAQESPFPRSLTHVCHLWPLSAETPFRLVSPRHSLSPSLNSAWASQRSAWRLPILWQQLHFLVGVCNCCDCAISCCWFFHIVGWGVSCIL